MNSFYIKNPEKIFDAQKGFPIENEKNMRNLEIEGETRWFWIRKLGVEVGRSKEVVGCEGGDENRASVLEGRRTRRTCMSFLSFKMFSSLVQNFEKA